MTPVELKTVLQEALIEQNHANAIVARAQRSCVPPISRTIAATLLDESMN
jgi:hypothetical protein